MIAVPVDVLYITKDHKNREILSFQVAWKCVSLIGHIRLKLPNKFLLIDPSDNECRFISTYKHNIFVMLS